MSHSTRLPTDRAPRQRPPVRARAEVVLKKLAYELVGRHLHRALRSVAVLTNPHLGAKLLPLPRVEALHGETYLVVGQRYEVLTADPDGLPVPPTHLREGWWGSDRDYLDSGRRDMDTMRRVLQAAGDSPEQLRRVLDFGCAAGRVLRFYPHGEDHECWGVDIKAEQIAWCEQHLSPPFQFALTTTFPHLPFEDNHFDLVFCNSVFTHITDLTDATLLELRRILRSGGLAYVTVHDEHSIEVLFNRFPHRGLTDMLRRLDTETGVLNSGYTFFSTGAEPWTLTFHDSNYLLRKWSGYMEVVSVTPEAMDYQTALLLRKEPPRSRAAPTARRSTCRP